MCTGRSPSRHFDQRPNVLDGVTAGHLSRWQRCIAELWRVASRRTSLRLGQCCTLFGGQGQGWITTHNLGGCAELPSTRRARESPGTVPRHTHTLLPWLCSCGCLHHEHCGRSHYPAAADLCAAAAAHTRHAHARHARTQPRALPDDIDPALLNRYHQSAFQNGKRCCGQMNVRPAHSDQTCTGHLLHLCSFLCVSFLSAVWRSC